MGLSGNKEKLKSKKLSVKRRRTIKLREIYAKTTQEGLDQNPKTLLDKQVESIQKAVNNKEKVLCLSRGQKKRLKNKVNKFASKQFLHEKNKEVFDQIEAEKKEKQRQFELQKVNQRKLNEGFMETDSKKPVNTLKDGFESMGNLLNKMEKQQKSTTSQKKETKKEKQQK